MAKKYLLIITHSDDDQDRANGAIGMAASLLSEGADLALGNPANATHDFRVGRGVHQFIQRRPQQPPAVPGDDRGGHNRGHFVRRGVVLAANERDRDADRGGQRSQRIAAMMPRVGAHR